MTSQLTCSHGPRTKSKVKRSFPTAREPWLPLSKSAIQVGLAASHCSERNTVSFSRVSVMYVCLQLLLAATLVRQILQSSKELLASVLLTLRQLVILAVPLRLQEWKAGFVVISVARAFASWRCATCVLCGLISSVEANVGFLPMLLPARCAKRIRLCAVKCSLYKWRSLA